MTVAHDDMSAHDDMGAHHEHVRAHREQMHRDPGTAVGRRRHWLIPALAVAGAVAVALVLLGVVSPAFVVYAGALAACGLMHIFGHGGHGGHGGHAGHGGGTPPAPR